MAVGAVKGGPKLCRWHSLAAQLLIAILLTPVASAFWVYWIRTSLRLKGWSRSKSFSLDALKRWTIYCGQFWRCCNVNAEAKEQSSSQWQSEGRKFMFAIVADKLLPFNGRYSRYQPQC
uniref:Secreted protein n=1 Tax=Panagrellus redivivus TaxID=6233 RepID=A0A7E4V2X2_PANRE